MTDAADRLNRFETMPLGVVLERRKSTHPWGDYSWKASDLLVGAPARDPRGDWLTLREEEDGERALHRQLQQRPGAKETSLKQLPLTRWLAPR